jgi:anti-sigma factor RsiW
MTWQQPETDQEWLECLSAYMDGELDDDEARAVAAALESNPERAAQLRTLRETRALMPAWDVDAPEPPPALLRRLEHADTPARPVRRFMPLRVQLQAALFLVGLFSGIAGTLLYVRVSDVPGAHTASPPVVHVTVAEPTISPQQAEVLMREVSAEGIKGDLLRQIRGRDWGAATETYGRLVEEYGDTSVVKALAEDRAVQRLVNLARYEEGNQS